MQSYCLKTMSELEQFERYLQGFIYLHGQRVNTLI